MKSVVTPRSKCQLLTDWPRTRGCVYAYRVNAEREALDGVVDEVDVARMVVALIDAQSPDAGRVVQDRELVA